MSTEARLFRKAALDRAAQPQELDHLIRVTDARGWLILVALGALLATAVGWSILGRVPTRVAGEGILLRSGGVFNLVSLGSGQVTNVLVRVGDEVKRGQIVARLAQPDLTEQIEKAKQKLEELRSQDERLAAGGAASKEVLQRSLAQERSALRKTIAAAEQRLSWLSDKMASQQRLFDQGLITKEALLATRREYQQVKEDIDRARTQIQQTQVRELEQGVQKDQENLSNQLRISEQERAVATLEEKLALASQIASPHDGRVIEVRTSEGSLVAPGTPILNLELTGTGTSAASKKPLEAVVYVPPAEGKKIKKGMEVQIAPSTVRREEHGVMLGVVRSVADFPATRQGMMRVLENEALVQRFMEAAGGAPIAVEVEMVSDPSTPSGFRWSSGQGPDARIDTGTLCSARITVKTERPVAYVLPIFASR